VGTTVLTAVEFPAKITGREEGGGGGRRRRRNIGDGCDDTRSTAAAVVVVVVPTIGRLFNYHPHLRE